MPLFVNMAVVIPHFSSVAFGRNYNLYSLRLHLSNELICVIGFIPEKVISRLAGNQIRSWNNVVNVSTGQSNTQRIAQCVNQSMNFSRQATRASADLLIEVPPFAPVPCWWTFTWEASIMIDSKSAPFDITDRMSSHMANLAHLANRL
jgi:hypothetical protein